MFVCSVKSPRSKVIAVVLIILLLLLGFIVCSQLDGGDPDSTGTTAPELPHVETENPVSYDAADASERMSFIAQFGWQVDGEPAEVTEVLIPAEFDEVYQKYNEIQLAQGLDLTQFAGERVKRWSYTVTNYPGYEGTDVIRIDLLVCKGVVVGGDVCSLEEDGFMHGFVRDAGASDGSEASIGA